jgi:hypothetical protein
MNVAEHGAVMKISGGEHGNGGENFSEIPGAQISRESHLAYIEFKIAHHAPHGRNQWVDWNEVQGQMAARCGTVPQGLGKTGVANDNR